MYIVQVYLQIGCAAADLNITQPGQEARGGDIRQWFAPLLVTDVLEGRPAGECSKQSLQLPGTAQLEGGRVQGGGGGRGGDVHAEPLLRATPLGVPIAGTQVATRVCSGQQGVLVTVVTLQSIH